MTSGDIQTASSDISLKPDTHYPFERPFERVVCIGLYTSDIRTQSSSLLPASLWTLR